jgi:hypothetical protein
MYRPAIAKLKLPSTATPDTWTYPLPYPETSGDKRGIGGGIIFMIIKVDLENHQIDEFLDFLDDAGISFEVVSWKSEDIKKEIKSREEGDKDEKKQQEIHG